MSSNTTQISTFPNSVVDVVRKNTFFKAFAAGVFSLSLIGGPAAEAGQSACPVFNAAMVDAAALVVQLKHEPALSVDFTFDDPSTGEIECNLSRIFGDTLLRFSLEVREEDGIFVQATEISPTAFNIRARSVGTGPRTPAVLHACRAQVLQSFVWNQYCAPELPIATHQPTDDDDDD